LLVQRRALHDRERIYVDYRGKIRPRSWIDKWPDAHSRSVIVHLAVLVGVLVAAALVALNKYQRTL
jgi:hypothetical protein